MREDTYDVLRIKNQLGFPLYACAREVIKQYKPFLDSLDLTYTQYITMMVLWEEKSLTVKELGDILYLDSGTLTPLLKKMETKGLITRKRSMQEERSLIVSITQKGDALKEKAVEVPAKLAQTLKLTPDECVQLHGLLNKMLD